MATLSALSAFPIASSSLAPTTATTTSVNILKDWAWIGRRYSLNFALSFNDGVAIDAVPFVNTTIEMGKNVTRNPYVNEKEVLDYRETVYSDTGIYGLKSWSWTLKLGGEMYWHAVRLDGALITSGGDYRYTVDLQVTVTTDGLSGNVQTGYDTGNGADVNLTFPNSDTALPLYRQSPGQGAFSGTVGLVKTLDWTFV